MLIGDSFAPQEHIGNLTRRGVLGVGVIGEVNSTAMRVSLEDGAFLIP